MLYRFQTSNYATVIATFKTIRIAEDKEDILIHVRGNLQYSILWNVKQNVQ